MRKCCFSIWRKQQTMEGEIGGRNPAYFVYHALGDDSLTKAVPK